MVEKATSALKKRKVTDKLVVKSNRLVEAKYKLSVREAKCILALISMIGAKDDDLKEYEISMETLKELIGPESIDSEVKVWGDRFTVFRNIFTELKSKPIRIEYDKGVLVTNWINDVHIEKYSGVIRFSFSPYLKPFLLQLKDNFTSYRLSEVSRLRSQYSIRFYELLAQYETIGKRRCGLTELRGMLGIDDNEYELYGHFKSRVLLPSQKELAARTRISFDYREIKKGRKVDALEFIIYAKPRDEKNETAAPVRKSKAAATAPPSLFDAGDAPQSLSPLQQELVRLGITAAQVIKLWQKGFDLVAADAMEEVALKYQLFDDYIAEKARMLAAQLAKEPETPDPFEWLLKALKNNWRESLTAQRKRVARQKNQSTQTRAELERRLQQLKMERAAAETLVIEQILCADAELLDQLVQEARAENSLLNNLYNPALSAFENYQKGSITLRPVVNEKIRALRPDVFVRLNERFSDKMDEILSQMESVQLS